MGRTRRPVKQNPIATLISVGVVEQKDNWCFVRTLCFSSTFCAQGPEVLYGVLCRPVFESLVSSSYVSRPPKIENVERSEGFEQGWEWVVLAS